VTDKIVVIGGGGHAKVLIGVLKKAGYDIAGYTDKEDREVILGVRYLGNDRVLSNFIRQNAGCKAIIGIGKIDVSSLRLRMQDEISVLGFQFPSICSPQSVVNEAVTLGAGTAVLDGVVVNSGTEIGRACILNTGSIVEHDCRIGENVHFAPGVTVCGGVTIGDNCMVGAGANIVQSIKICEGCLIGAGSTIVEDISMRGTYAGSPAKRLR
jgi:sugar O-acyltransferase (sialic acid O-acetyltransferase NeuD family)